MAESQIFEPLVTDCDCSCLFQVVISVEKSVWVGTAAQKSQKRLLASTFKVSVSKKVMFQWNLLYKVLSLHGKWMH
jgi:hypothetical protein